MSVLKILNLRLLFLLMPVFLLSCTSARWTVKEKTAVDTEDYTVLDSDEFLSITSEVSPENPNLNLQVLSNTRYEYAQKVLVQRTIQDYKIKKGIFALGLIGAGLAAFAANSNAINGGPSSAASLSLNAAAVVIAGAGLMNMRPVGEPRLTGEERYLRKVGTVIQEDTLQINDTPDQSASVSVWYGQNELLKEDERGIQGGELNINLGGLLNNLEIQGTDFDKVRVEVRFQDSTYIHNYSLDQILLPYARITSPVTELRSSPERQSENVLAELIEGSQLQIVNQIDSEWYRILYGISENYIAQNDAELIWRSSDFDQQSEVIAVPFVPFGNIDVENNIPILSGVNQNSLGLIITNENYDEPYEKRSFAHRDGKLIRAYFENALGMPTENLYEIQDLATGDSLDFALNEMRLKANDSTSVYIYLNGYGSIRDNKSEFDLVLQTPGRNNDPLDMSTIFEKISRLENGKLLLLGDIEFHTDGEDPLISESELDLKQPLRALSQIITDSNPYSTVIFGSEINQQSELYVTNRGEDKKHHIFPYFFAKALQQRVINMGSIFQYLQRNIPYTSRRLHDRSQDPKIFGNTSQALIPNR